MKYYYYDDYEDVEDIDIEYEQTEKDSECCCSRGCFDCLGMSWRDFF